MEREESEAESISGTSPEAEYWQWLHHGVIEKAC